MPNTTEKGAAMTMLTILRGGFLGAVHGSGRRVLRSVRDGLIALGIFIAYSFMMAGQLPAAALAASAAVLRVDPTAPGAEEMLRVLTFGSFAIVAIGQAIYVAILSLLIRTAHAAYASGRAAARAAADASSGGTGDNGHV